MPYLVMQQEVDGQCRTLEQPCLQVGRHPRLPGQNRLKPQGGSIARYRLTERLAFLVCRMDRVAKRKRRLHARVGHRAARAARADRTEGTDGPAWAASRVPLSRACPRPTKA